MTKKYSDYSVTLADLQFARKELKTAAQALIIEPICDDFLDEILENREDGMNNLNALLAAMEKFGYHHKAN